MGKAGKDQKSEWGNSIYKGPAAGEMCFEQPEGSIYSHRADNRGMWCNRMLGWEWGWMVGP